MHNVAAMIALTPLLLMAQAVTPCTTAGTPRLGGGAVLVRPVGSFAARPFEQLGPAEDVRQKPRGVQQAGAADAGGEPQGDASGQQCAAPVSIA